MKFKQFLHRELDPTARKAGVSISNQIICVFILFAVLLAMLETEEALALRHERFFLVAEAVLFVLFLIEYCLRVYSAPVNPAFAGRFGRVRYIFSIWAIIDLLALLPFLLMAVDASAYYLRLARMLRILRLARLGRFTTAWELLGSAVRNRKYELMLSGVVAFSLLLVSSTFLYVLEAEEQPEAFGSIPRALWWSVATLTTVGYGDVTPVTATGRFFAGLTAVAGIGLVAMPTGILAAAFSDAFQDRQKRERGE